MSSNLDVVYAIGKVRAPLPNGSLAHFPPGSHWPADDPFVRANPSLFSADPRYHLAFTEPQEWYLDPGMSGPPETAETATAVPGERRNARRGN